MVLTCSTQTVLFIYRAELLLQVKGIIYWDLEGIVLLYLFLSVYFFGVVDLGFGPRILAPLNMYLALGLYVYPVRIYCTSMQMNVSCWIILFIYFYFFLWEGRIVLVKHETYFYLRVLVDVVVMVSCIAH